MIRRTLRIAAVLLAALAMPVTMLVTSSPASAAGSTICEAFDHMFCVGAPGLMQNNPVEETVSGRLLDPVLQTNQFEGHDTYRIEFNASPNKSMCLGSLPGALFEVAVEPCSTGTGVVWARVKSNGVDLWINRNLTQVNGVDEYLTGSNQAGSQFFMDALGGASGDRQRFTPF